MQPQRCRPGACSGAGQRSTNGRRGGRIRLFREELGRLLKRFGCLLAHGQRHAQTCIHSSRYAAWRFLLRQVLHSPAVHGLLPGGYKQEVALRTRWHAQEWQLLPQIRGIVIRSRNPSRLLTTFCQITYEKPTNSPLIQYIKHVG